MANSEQRAQEGGQPAGYSTDYNFCETKPNHVALKHTAGTAGMYVSADRQTSSE